MQTRGKPASRLQVLDRKLKLSESFWPLLWARIRTHGSFHSDHVWVPKVGKELGGLESPKTWRADARQACKFFCKRYIADLYC